MKITEFIKDHFLVLDGGMGTLLQAEGLLPGELPERWNLTHKDAVKAIHRAYYDAGSHVVNTNTFGANSLKFSLEELEKIVSAAIENAKAAAKESQTPHEKWVALDIGPTGKMLRPYGDLDFEEAVSVFAETVKLGVKYGADLIMIETMNDSYETKAALLAAKENSTLPVFVSNAYGEDGKLLTGASPLAVIAMLEGMGADAVGINCSLGPDALAPIAEEYLKHASVPVLLKPNAGLPHTQNGKTVYDVSPTDFAREMRPLIEKGVRIFGGCCGTSPAYIKEVAQAAQDLSPKPICQKEESVISSYTHAVSFGASPVLIGERINPTGKKRFKEALLANDMDYILKEGLAEEEKGVHVLDVNVGLPSIDETQMLKKTVFELQSVTSLPLQIDTADVCAMEAALRVYNGKPMINSVNGKKESMQAVFPLVKKYGGLTVALTLDENGIPATAEGRLAIAEKILSEAEKYGVGKKDIIFDPLALTVSADGNAAKETLRAIALIREKLGCLTSLGVSNVSFGLPARDSVNSTFFALALGEGLSAAIMNPHSAEMMKTYYAYRALAGIDENCADYIAYADAIGTPEAAPPSAEADSLSHAVFKGLKEAAAALTEKMLADTPPLDIVNFHIIPALDKVGVGYEEKKIYLPSLLMSAEAASAAFEVIKARMPADKTKEKCRVVLATVKGDIHDIGKNIVKLILENYGFAVTDLGKDVAPEEVVKAAETLHAPIVGLSALMTTTLPAMEETVRLLRKRAPWCRILVGGAVLTEEYAAAIGADHYAKDAMEAVRIAEKIYAVLPSCL